MSISIPETAETVDIDALAKQAVEQGGLGKDDLALLVNAPLEKLCAAANAIRKRCCGNGFELCSIMNVKSGRCSENCRFCAQSQHWNAEAACYPFAEADDIVERGVADARLGSQRFSLVASGPRVSAADIERACVAARRIRKQTDAEVCVSFGLLSRKDFERLHAAGVTRVHNNLETSRSFFPRICTTHDYDQKIEALDNARAAGMQVCSGGIVGLGESWGDRIELALDLQKLHVTSVPINVLNPIAGTPLEGSDPLSVDEVRRIFALFRFALPYAALRLAGGRALLPNAGSACLGAGANAAISGNMLTTAGFDIPSDKAMIERAGFRLVRKDR